MKLVKIVSAAALAVAMTGAAQAATVFESFPNYALAGNTPSGYCSSCTGYGAVFASFSLASNETLNKAYVLVMSSVPADAYNHMTIGIFNDGGDDLPARNSTGGMLAPFLSVGYTAPTSVTATDTRTDAYDNYVVEFALPDWSLSAGKYWVRFAGYSNLLPVYATATPEHSRMIGTDFLAEGRNVTLNTPGQAIGFSLNGVDVVPGGVPEPGTWAMMIFGFGLVGATMRRRGLAGISFA